MEALDSELDVFALRRDLVKGLLEGPPFLSNQRAFAEAIDTDPTTVSRWFMDGKGKKNIGEESARKIEARLKLPPGSLVLPEKRNHPLPTVKELSELHHQEEQLLDVFRELDVFDRTIVIEQARGIRAVSKRRKSNDPEVAHGQREKARRRP